NIQQTQTQTQGAVNQSLPSISAATEASSAIVDQEEEEEEDNTYGDRPPLSDPPLYSVLIEKSGARGPDSEGLVVGQMQMTAVHTMLRHLSPQYQRYKYKPENVYKERIRNISKAANTITQKEADEDEEGMQNVKRSLIQGLQESGAVETLQALLVPGEVNRHRRRLCYSSGVLLAHINGFGLRAWDGCEHWRGNKQRWKRPFKERVTIWNQDNVMYERINKGNVDKPVETENQS
ncbi:MAG: hypothetical protein EZS28_029297, partial [Streblomastix strix]